MIAVAPKEYPEYISMTTQQLVDERHRILANYRSWPDAEERISFIHAHLKTKPPLTPGARRR